MAIKSQVPILIADDDIEDCEMIRDAFKESRLLNDVFFVHNGEELLEFLKNEKQFKDKNHYPRPGLIIMDMNMPKMNGKEALGLIKTDPNFRQIPIIILTTIDSDEEIFKTYDLGVSSFITKPISFDALVSIVKEIGHYWFEIVHLPSNVE